MYCDKFHLLGDPPDRLVLASLLDEDRPGDRERDLLLSEESPVGAGSLLGLFPRGLMVVGFSLIFRWFLRDRMVVEGA